VEEHWLYERLTIVTVAEVLLERIGASRVNPGGEVAIVVVRVCHIFGSLITLKSGRVEELSCWFNV